jgi:glycosyltransferase involved in cell wall biosynthesis
MGYSPSVLVVVGGFPAVSQTFVLREVAAMKAVGWRVLVLATEPGDADGWSQADEFGVTQDDVVFLNWRNCLPGMRWQAKRVVDWLGTAEITSYGRKLALRRLGYFARVEQIVQRFGADVIHCHFVQWAAEVGLGLSQLLGLPLTLTAHDGHLTSYSSDRLRRIQQQAHGIACVCREWVNVWRSKTGSAEKLSWIPNGVMVHEFSNATRSWDGPIRLLSVSYCTIQKRPQDLVQAVALLRANGVNITCQIIGGGPYFNELTACVRRSQLEDVVWLRGYQPHAVVREAMANSDIFALCSEWESFGVVTAEAMAAGMPVVVSDTPGSRDLVIPDKTGLVFPAGSCELLARHLQRLVEDNNLRISMGVAGRCRVESNFSWRSHMEQMLRLWKGAIDDGVASRASSLSTA